MSPSRDPGEVGKSEESEKRIDAWAGSSRICTAANHSTSRQCDSRVRQVQPPPQAIHPVIRPASRPAKRPASHHVFTTSATTTRSLRREGMRSSIRAPPTEPNPRHPRPNRGRRFEDAESRTAVCRAGVLLESSCVGKGALPDGVRLCRWSIIGTTFFLPARRFFGVFRPAVGKRDRGSGFCGHGTSVAESGGQRWKHSSYGVRVPRRSPSWLVRLAGGLAAPPAASSSPCLDWVLCVDSGLRVMPVRQAMRFMALRAERPRRRRPARPMGCTGTTRARVGRGRSDTRVCSPEGSWRSPPRSARGSTGPHQPEARGSTRSPSVRSFARRASMPSCERGRCSSGTGLSLHRPIRSDGSGPRRRSPACSGSSHQPVRSSRQGARQRSSPRASRRPSDPVRRAERVGMTVSPTRTGWTDVGWTDTGWIDVGAVIRTEPTQRGQRRRDGSGVGSALNPCSMLPIARMTGPLDRLGAACG